VSGVGLGAGVWGQSLAQNYMGDFMNGFLGAAQVTLSIDDPSKTLTVTPVGSTFTIYSAGNKLTLAGTKSVAWTATEGLHFFYFNEAGTLVTTTTFTPEIITKYCYVALIYWSIPQNKAIYFGNERHGVLMGPSTHLYLHNTRGAQFDNGLKLVNFLVDGTGNDAANAQFTSESGVIWDEDIRYSLPAQTQFPVFYREGTVWKQKTPDAFPVIYNGTAGYTGTRMPYNLNTAGTWSLQEIDSNKFALVHVLATNDINYPVICLLGVNQYISKTAARDGAAVELQSLSGLPFAEFAPLGSVIFETQNSYTNTPKARIVSIDSKDYFDLRATYFRPGAF